MNLKIKRIYEAPTAEDGLRVFVDRLWARGISKEKAKIDFWEKAVAPSNELRKWFAHDAAKFGEFKKRYFSELDENALAAAFAQRISQEKNPVTLLFAARDAEHNNAAVLREWLLTK